MAKVTPGHVGEVTVLPMELMPPSEECSWSGNPLHLFVAETLSPS